MNRPTFTYYSSFFIRENTSIISTGHSDRDREIEREWIGIPIICALILIISRLVALPLSPRASSYPSIQVLRLIRHSHYNLICVCRHQVYTYTVERQPVWFIGGVRIAHVRTYSSIVFACPKMRHSSISRFVGANKKTNADEDGSLSWGHNGG